MTKRFQFGLRLLIVAVVTMAVMYLIVFPLWIALAVARVRGEEDRWWRERYAAPPDWECPPGYHLDENGWVVRDGDGRGNK